MSDDPTEGIGHGHPPKHSQFRPGQSGNPSGRPKKARSIRSDLTEELSATIRISDGKTSDEISKQRAIIKALVNAALAGNLRAVATVLDFCAKNQDDATYDISLEEIEILEAHQNTKSEARKD